MLHTRTITLLTLAALLIFSSAAFAQSPNTGAVILYQVSGTFVSPPVSGNDLLLLAGYPFTMTVIGNTQMRPTKHGPQWGLYTDLSMQGHVVSGFNPEKHFALKSQHVTLLLDKGNPDYDEVKATFDTVVEHIKLTIVGDFQMPKGTLVHFFIEPFANSVTLTPTNATVTYSGNNNGQHASTTLAVQSGTLDAHRFNQSSVTQALVLLPQADPVALVRRMLDSWLNA
jgi:hypothetical protein